MNWKELFGGVVVTALIVLFALWTTDWEIGSKCGFVVANLIICFMSVALRVSLNPVFFNKEFSWINIRDYFIGALITTITTLVVGI